MLPDGGSRIDLKNRGLLAKYAADNVQHWYRFAKTKRRIDAPNGSLCVITGCDKARSYELAAFHNPSYKGQEVSFQLSISNIASAAGEISYAETLNCKAEKRRSTEVQSAENQAVFLRGFKLSIRHGLWAKLAGEVKATSIAHSPLLEIISECNPFQSINDPTPSFTTATVPPSPSSEHLLKGFGEERSDRDARGPEDTSTNDMVINIINRLSNN